MVNSNSGQNNEQYWYPRLPEGYDGNTREQLGGPIPMPSINPSGYPTGYGWPTYEMPSSHPGFTAQRPSHGMPGFPPGHGGMPGFPPGHNMPGFPPGHGGPSHGMPGFPPGHGNQPGRPPGQHGSNQAPQSAPPSWTPEYPSHQLFAVDPGAISRCLYRFTFVWLSRRQGFWFYPVFVGRTSVAGYRWNSRRRRWEYTGLDLNNINSFTCT
ncbi:hypothetical protein [Sporosarcina ureilytica]|nr:hypothetical protein [Sporosarcina ureilytica]